MPPDRHRLAADQAVQGLEKAVNRVLDRYERQRVQRRLPEITHRTHLQHLSAHLRHALTMLGRQLASLQAAVNAWQHVWPKKLVGLRNRNSASTTQWLAHLFVQMMRLHDGLVLCISGECRHQADRKNCKKRYASHLNRSSGRSDGYTRLYKADAIYSGTAWDELLDDEHGLKTRLLTVVKRYVPPKGHATLWEQRLETPALESLLESLETQLQSLEAQLTTIGNQLRDGLPQYLAVVETKHTNTKSVSVTLDLRDKMERLVCQINGKVYKLERLAGTFEVNDDRGVLPLVDELEWKRIFLTLPTSSNTATTTATKDAGNIRRTKKRRAILEDSSGEDDDHTNKDDETKNPPKKKKGTGPALQGLSIKVVERQKNSSSTNNAVSLQQIKQTMGVNAKELEASRDIVEREQKQASKAAAIVDATPTDEIVEGADDNTDEEAHAKKLTMTIQNAAQLKRALQRLYKSSNNAMGDADDQVWDLRESLREALMTAGNLLLWKPTPRQQQQQQNLEASRRQELQLAVEYFFEARYCVEAQQMLWQHKYRKSQANEEEETWQNLKLLCGQAHVNTGISLVEQSKWFTASDAERKSSLKRAGLELEEARTVAESLVAKLDDGASTTASLDKDRIAELLFAACQLQCLAIRWHSNTLWRQGRTHEASRRWQSAWECGKKYQQNKASLELQTECYYAAVTAVDRISAALVNMKKNRKKEHEDFLWDSLEVAFESAKELSDVVRALAPGAYIVDNDVRSRSELQLSYSELKNWWNEQKELSRQVIISDLGQNSATTLPRSDLLNHDRPSIQEPTDFINLNEQQKRSHNHRFLGGGNRYSNIVVPQAPLPDDSIVDGGCSDPKGVVFRRWGDELLPQDKDKVSGQNRPRIIYPCVAPPMPEEIREALERNLRAGQEQHLLKCIVQK